MPFPYLGDIPNPGIKPISPASAGSFFTTQPRMKKRSTKNYIKRWGHIKPESFQGPKRDWPLYVTNKVKDKMGYNRKSQINVQQSILLEVTTEKMSEGE